ncbi:MAG: hypothetical protein ACPGOY_04830 [Rhodospirillaceae bacterium]
MNWTLAVGLIGALSLVSVTAWSNQDHHGHGAYAGFQDRAISSLSDQDIADIEQGRGWGLALPAELNGLPGPVHLLELKEDLGLSPDQIAAFEAIYADMRAEAIAAGAVFLQAERTLSQAFKDKVLSPEDLFDLVAAAAKARADLRYVHLSRHLMTPELLTASQIERYAVLRGYRQDPCAEVPEGHDPAMWRRHNGCE